MSHAIARTWTLDEFFAWQDRQDERYELVGGVPVRMMAGARAIHDRVVVNLIAGLQIGLRGDPCRPFSGDGSVETYPGQIRRPDAGVDCGRFDPNALKAVQPRLVAEVLSPSTRDFDTFGKVVEYRSVDSLDYILIVEPNAPEIVLWSRDDARAWRESRIDGLGTILDLPAIGIALPLADLYEGVTFPEPPVRLAL